MYRITFIDGPLKGRKLTVHEDRLCIGRDADCSLRMSDPAIAGRHAEFEVRDRVVHVRRASADAVVTINGVPVGDTGVALRRGEVLGLGDHRLRVDADAGPIAIPSRTVVNLTVVAGVAVAALVAVQGALLARAFALGREVRAMPTTPAYDPAATTAAPDEALSGVLPDHGSTNDPALGPPRTHLLRNPPTAILDTATAPTNQVEGVDR
jgi:predicted component of type VI protein secretion system